MIEAKIIVTNQDVLKTKYPRRISEIQNALDIHKEIGKAHSINTTVVYIDDEVSMRGIGDPVTNAQSQEQNKSAIDAVYNHYNPDYLLLLGSIDVIPHQELNNPLLGEEDKDPNIPSDLPYASDSSYSKNIEDFRAPTRKIGRLPDITGSSKVEKKEITYLINLLTNENRYKKYPQSSYQDYFGLSTATWEKSTKLSLANIFGSDKALFLSPPNTDGLWTKEQLRKYSHFINCHGSSKDPHYYGEKEGKFPYSLSAHLVKGCIVEGNITAAECCYGAQLYDPDDLPYDVDQDLLSMCNRYLSEGCVAFLGSSTIAYGPSEGNSSADLITQYFIKNMLDGLSAGASCLKARQDFVTKEGLYDPTSLKTLGQFNLMGDPAVRPVQLSTSNIYQEFLNLQAVSHIEKRDFERKAKYITENIGWSSPQADAAPSIAAKAVISKIIQKENIDRSTLYTYVVQRPKASGETQERLASPERVHLLMHQTEQVHPLSTQLIAYTIKESNGEVYDVKREESKR